MVKTSPQSDRLNKTAPAARTATNEVYLAEAVAVSHQRDFAVNVTFSDGTRRTIDLKPYLHGPIFEPVLRDPKMFRAVRIQGGTIGWDNGADIDPDTLYYDGNPPWTKDSVSHRKRVPKTKSRLAARPKARA